MPRKWASIYPGLLALVLAAGLIVAGFGLVSGEEPSPSARPEKLDAVLTGLLAQQKAAGEPTTGGGADKLLPLHRDEAGNIYVDVLMKSSGSLAGYDSLGVTVQAVVGDVVAARIPLRSLSGLTNLATVDSMEASLLLYPSNDVGGPASGAPVFRNTTGVDGSGAIVGVIDTGVDFTHGDFRNPDGTTRIKFLCDQTDPPQPADNTCPGGGSPAGGTLWTEAQINTSLQGGPTVRQTDGDGHGTHVLGSAAGDDAIFGGMAPGADLIVVKAGNAGFPTTNIVSGISFIDDRAASLGLPYVINMSLGGQIGPHDGTDLMSQAINGVTGPGRPGKVVAVAAGNDGGDAIHASGNVGAGTQTRSSNLPGGTEAAFVDIWYEGQDSFGFSFTPPGSGSFGPFIPGAFFSTCFPGTHTCVQVDHTVPQAGNGDIEVFMVIFPASGFQTIDLTGAWSFSLAGNVVNDGNFDAWIQCNGSFCGFTGGDSLSTIGQPGVAQTAITVGSYTTKDCWPSIAGGSFCWNPLPIVGEISFFSSLGPTRDGRQKPDIAGPGEAVVSSKSKDASFIDPFIAPDNKHVTLRGTSMATPLVAGAVALLLAANPNLDSAQIKGMLQSTAAKDGFTGPGCGNTWGCGKLNLAPLANAAPNAVDDSATVADGGTVTVLDSGQASVLANDTDPEANLLAVATVPVSGPANGSLTLNANGTFSYTHDGTETTTDGFTYRVCDNASLSRCATADVTIAVNQVLPGAPTLVSPASGDSTNDNTPFFGWTPSTADVADYQLQVTSGGSFNPHLDIEVVIPHPGTGHQTVSPLNDATYRWRVVARDLALNTASSVTRTFTVDTVNPGVVLLVAPANNALLRANIPLFQWQPTVLDVFDYVVRVTRGDINAGVVVVDNIVVQHPTLTFQPTVNLPDGSYQWRVTSRDRALNAASSVTRTFTVDTNPPGTPSLDSPLDNAFLNDNTPFFEWGPSAGDVSDYLLQVTSGDIISGPFDIEVTVLHPGTGHQAVAPLSDASYHWQVIARDLALNMASSVTRTFTVDTAAPGIPDLLSPPNNTIFNDSTPLFVWDPASGDVTTYELRITSADINNGPLDVQVFVLAPTTQFQTPGGVALTDGTYIWRVIARDSAGNPQQYGVFIFSVDTVAPDAPALLAPADNASLGTRTPFFDWEDAPITGDVVIYELHVTSGGSFDGPIDMDVVIIGAPLATQFQTPVGDALADGTYIWRVIAFDKGGNTTISVVRSFTISRPPLLAETSLVQSIDLDGVAVLEVSIDGVVDATGDAFSLLGGIGRYEAQVDFDIGCMAILDVRGVPPFVAPQHTIVGGRLLITADQATAAPQAPLTLAKLVVRLTGDATTPCGVSLIRLRILESLGNNGEPIPASGPQSKSFLRGDASGNGVVNSFDALVILQFVVGMPLRLPAGEEPGKLRPIEAAGVFQDGVSGDTVSAFDALAIQQFLVELRDPLFLLK